MTSTVRAPVVGGLFSRVAHHSPKTRLMSVPPQLVYGPRGYDLPPKPNGLHLGEGLRQGVGHVLGREDPREDHGGRIRHRPIGPTDS